MVEDELEIYKVDAIYQDPMRFLKLMEIFPNNTNETFTYDKLLEKIFGPKDQNVLIVGNGPSAMENQIGESIDGKMDKVIRINNYQTKGYEKFVGSKTDIWANCVGEKTIPRKVSKDVDILTFIGRMSFSKSYASREVYSKIKNYMEVKRIYHTYEIQSKFERYYKFRNKLTTGLMSIILLSAYYSKPIYCIGFDFYSYSKNYYFNNNLPLSRKHNLNFEKKMYKYLLRKGVIKILDKNEISRIDASKKLVKIL